MLLGQLFIVALNIIMWSQISITVSPLGLQQGFQWCLWLTALFCTAEASCLQNRIFKIYDLQTEVELWCMCSVNDSSTVTWYKYSINGSRQLIATGPPDEFKYTFILENASQGGLYQCECSANSCTGSCSQCFQLSGTGSWYYCSVLECIIRCMLWLLRTIGCNGHFFAVNQHLQILLVQYILGYWGVELTVVWWLKLKCLSEVHALSKDHVAARVCTQVRTCSILGQSIYMATQYEYGLWWHHKGYHVRDM